MNNLQLLFASLLVVIVNAYLHAVDNNSFLKYSFIFTSIMISGIGAAIVTKPIGINYLVHYIVFALLLITVMVDQKKLITAAQGVTREEKPLETTIIKPSSETMSTTKPLSLVLGETPVKDVTIPGNVAKAESISHPKSIDTHIPIDEPIMIPGSVSEKPIDEKLREIEENIDKIMLEKEEKTVEEQIKEKHTSDIREIVDPFYADILKNIGIVTVEDLVRQEPNELVKRMDDYILDNIDKYLEDPENRKKIRIDSNLVSNWIEKAKIFFNKT